MQPGHVVPARGHHEDPGGIVTAWQPGQPVPPGYCTVIEEDGSEHLAESWPDSPCSEPVEEDDA